MSHTPRTKPTPSVRRGNLISIAADATVNFFAREVCAEAQDYIATLEQKNADMSEALETLLDWTALGEQSEEIIQARAALAKARGQA